ncbi:hypothetical protein KS18_16800 [Photorhabdus luminescens]|nr:hypothetical protein KS18_16800 [Photorhabdus luminescens]
MRLYLTGSLVLLLSLLSFHNSYAKSENNSDVYFSCNTKKGNVKLEIKDGTLSYSLSKEGINSFIFNSFGDNYSGFLYNHYTRYQTEYIYVSFVNENYRYTVFDNYENNEKSSGVSVVNNDNKKEFLLMCKTVKKNNLRNLITFLACDKDNALGC